MSAILGLKIEGAEAAAAALRVPEQVAAAIHQDAATAMRASVDPMVDAARALMAQRTVRRTGESASSIGVKRTEETPESVTVVWGGSSVINFLDRGTGAHRDGTVQTDPNAHAKGGIRPRGIIADAVRQAGPVAQRQAADAINAAIARENAARLKGGK